VVPAAPGALVAAWTVVAAGLGVAVAAPTATPLPPIAEPTTATAWLLYELCEASKTAGGAGLVPR